MIVVPHFCAKDWQATVKNIEWWISLDGRCDFHCILSHDDQTPKHGVAQVEAVARQFFASVETYWYPAPVKKSWPAAPNHAWQNTARYLAHINKDSWLWLESDAIAIRAGWLRDIAAEHKRAGKAFSGHLVDGLGHINGVAVYPPNVAQYSNNALLVEESAWDVVLGSDLALMDGGVMANCHPSHTLFQHCWCINPETGKAWNGSGELATFKNTRDVVRLVDLTMALFHRCKDGSLIEMLRKHYAHPELAMVPQHIEQHEEVQNKEVAKAVPQEQAVTTTDTGTHKSGGGQSSETPIVVSGAIDRVPETEPELSKQESPQSELGYSKFTGKCEILIVTYGLPTKRVSGKVVSDFDWLRLSLRCIRKFCKGFQGITIAIPNRDAEMLKPIANEHAQSKSGIPLRIQMYSERDGKGMIQHMAMMAGAEQLVPKTTTHVVHVDADYMFKEPVTPDDYFDGDKPIYVVRSWDSLVDKERNVTSDCLQWREPTDKQLGFESSVYAMCRFPFAFPVNFYAKYRDHIESVQGKPFIAYMLSGRNEFPQTRLDFTAMGAYAYAKMRDSFRWIDVSGGNHLAPKDKINGFWSHGGITPEIEKEIEGFLA